jgi:glycosyltransferase involved in cell wall biosynthesis
VTTRRGAAFVTTVGSWASPDFHDRSRRIEVPPRLDIVPRREFHPGDELTLFRRVLGAGLREDLLLLFSSRGALRPELAAIIALGFLPRRLRGGIVLYGEMFQPNSGWRHTVERIVMRLVDRGVDRYALHTDAEVEVFCENWNVSPEKVRGTGFFLANASPPPPERSVRGDHVFAGGTSFRDYESLIEAARLLPERRFVACTDQLDGRTDLPANIEAGLVTPDRFNELISTAGVVVVPLKTDVRRIAGMLTYLQSMWRGTPTVCSSALGASEYIDDGVTGLLVGGSPHGYAKAIEWALDPDNAEEVDRMCVAAQQAVAERFLAEHHTAKLLSVVDEVAGLRSLA